MTEKKFNSSSDSLQNSPSENQLKFKSDETPQTVFLNLPKKILANERERRKKQTPAEEFLWCCLRNRRLTGLKFRRQHPLPKGFVLDFYCAERLLGIEIDGGYHEEIDQKEYDAVRTFEIGGYGIKVLRFANNEVIENIEYVKQTIVNECSLRQTKK